MRHFRFLAALAVAAIFQLPTASAEGKASGQVEALIAQGKQIFNDTPKYAGRFVNNKLSCSSCHLDGGTRVGSAPLWAAELTYPRYQAKTRAVVTLEQRMQQCFVFSEAGTPPALDSHVILALSAYAHSLSKGKTVGSDSGAGFTVLPETSHDGDPVAGAEVYSKTCAACHGRGGAGLTQNGQVIFPPLWGWNSYRKGAGMANPSMAARFIWANMPPGASPDHPSLTADQAKDVAVFIDEQWRRPDPRKGILGWLP